MGRQHVQRFGGMADIELAAVCDVDPDRREHAAQIAKDSSGVLRHEDYRRVLDDPGIDTISVATPDHWHAKIALEAVLADKHVYVEKPCSHTVEEGLLLIEAARKYGKCIQQGTQGRSSQGWQDAVRFMHDGHLGKVRFAKAINCQLRDTIGRAPEKDPPPGVNYDLWLGPAPEHRFTENRWHYNWHWFWDYGTGGPGNDGIHELDAARWGLNVGLPKKISAPGEKLFFDDDHETPDTQMVTMIYDDCHLNYEMRLWTDYKFAGHDNGVIFFGDKGSLEIGRHGCFVHLIGEEPKEIGGGRDLTAHMRNFLDCVRAGDPSGLNSSVEFAALTAETVHLANITSRVGQELEYDGKAHRFTNSEAANQLLSKKYRQGYELPGLT